MFHDYLLSGPIIAQPLLKCAVQSRQGLPRQPQSKRKRMGASQQVWLLPQALFMPCKCCEPCLLKRRSRIMAQASTPIPFNLEMQHKPRLFLWRAARAATKAAEYSSQDPFRRADGGVARQSRGSASRVRAGCAGFCPSWPRSAQAEKHRPKRVRTGTSWPTPANCVQTQPVEVPEMAKHGPLGG